jgi:hypothetical protein
VRWIPAGARQDALENPAKRSPQPDFNFSHAQMVDRALVGPLQVHIVDADHFSAVDVDDLAVDQVPLQEEITAVVLEWSKRLS